jgi:sugar phosphate isomerase/epimerase
MRRLALTSWSLHHELSSGALKLIDLPQRMREVGYTTLELCHFHLPDTEPATLAAMRAAISAANVELYSVLIDAGDLSAADSASRATDRSFVERWIDAAAALGAQGVRIVGGDAAPNDTEALARSAAELRDLVAYATQRGVYVRTENFRPLLSTAANCLALLDAVGSGIGLCADVGNFPKQDRVAEFSAVAAHASVIHVKSEYAADGQILPQDVQACLASAVAAGFDGPYTLVYDRGGDSWAKLAELAEVVQPYV